MMENKQLLWTYTAIFIVCIIITGFFTENKLVWFLDTAIIIILLIVLNLTQKKYEFSKTSYTLIFIYLILPLIASYYTPNKVPIGYLLGNFFGAERNPYDRLVHFSFGLLIYYPILEILKNTSQIKKGFWLYFIPLMTITAGGALYEIGEWINAINVSYENSAVYLGMQGDLWDAQKDMFVAALGAITTMIWSISSEKYTKLKNISKKITS